MVEDVLADVGDDLQLVWPSTSGSLGVLCLGHVLGRLQQPVFCEERRQGVVLVVVVDA